MIQKTKGLKRKEAEILIENKGSSPIWFSFCARKQQETQNLSSGQTLCRSVSRAWAQGYSSSAVPVLDGQIWDKRESQVSANTEPALQLFCKTVSCSPLSPWQSGLGHSCVPSVLETAGPAAAPLTSAVLRVTLLVCMWGAPKGEATADPILGSSCISTDAIFPGIIHIERDCPRVNHYPVF